MTTKLNNNVRKALSEASIQAQEHASFDRFSYEVDWSNFPNSLLVTGHLKSDYSRSSDCDDPAENLKSLDLIQSNFSKLVQLSLLKQGIKFRDFRKNFALAYNS